MTLNEYGNYEPWIQPDYGNGPDGVAVQPEPGFAVLPQGAVILPGDRPFDVYSGWIDGVSYHTRNGLQARSEGRWTCWERPLTDTVSPGLTRSPVEPPGSLGGI